MSRHMFPWREAFLAALREMPVVQHACDAVGIERSTAYRSRQVDDEFAKAWEEAMEAGVDRAEQEAFRRGVVGFHEPVIDKGHLCFVYERYLDDAQQEQWRMKLDDNGQPVPLTIRKHSDQLLALILKGRRKQVYAERTEVTGADGGPVATDNTVRATRVAALLEAARRRKEAEDFG
jgi:hypothetical protein